jgi:hypothetical protein
MFFVRVTFYTDVPEHRSILQFLIPSAILRKVIRTWVRCGRFTKLFQSEKDPTHIIYWKNNVFIKLCCTVASIWEIHWIHDWMSHIKEVQVFGFVCEYFVKRYVFSGEGLLAPRPTSKLKDHPLSAVHDCLFSIYNLEREGDKYIKRNR